MISLNQLLKSSAVFALFTFFSRVLGLVREIVFAVLFGATGYMDAFLVAFKIPNFFRRLFAEGAFNQAFVPVLAEYTHGDIAKGVAGDAGLDNNKNLTNFIAAVSGLLATICFIMVILGVVFSGSWVLLFAPGFYNAQAKSDLASELLMITFPYLGFITLSALSSSILNIYGKFALPALTPIWLNISLIVAGVFVSPYLSAPIIALAWGVLVAGIIQFLFLLPALYKVRCLVWPSFRFLTSLQCKGVRKLLTQLVPACIGASVTQISLLMDTIFASFLVSGSISWLYYSDRLMQFPLGVFGVALSTVILPTLSKLQLKDDKSDFKAALNWGCRWVLILALPSALGLIVLAEPLVITLFYHGKFMAHDVYSASMSLKAFSSGLLFFMLVKVLVSAYYSQKNIKTPVKIAFFALSINFILNIILVKLLAHVGIALASVCAGFVNCLLLWVGLVRSRVFSKYFCLSWAWFLFRILLSSIIMLVFIKFFLEDPKVWMHWSVFSRVWHLLCLLGLGIGVYMCSLVAFRVSWRQLIFVN